MEGQLEPHVFDFNSIHLKDIVFGRPRHFGPGLYFLPISIKRNNEELPFFHQTPEMTFPTFGGISEDVNNGERKLKVTLAFKADDEANNKYMTFVRSFEEHLNTTCKNNFQVWFPEKKNNQQVENFHSVLKDSPKYPSMLSTKLATAPSSDILTKFFDKERNELPFASYNISTDFVGRNVYAIMEFSGVWFGQGWGLASKVWQFMLLPKLQKRTFTSCAILLNGKRLRDDDNE